MKEDKTTRGGSRPGAGRPRKGNGLCRPVTFSFSVDQLTRQMARDLRAAGFDLNTAVEDFIANRYLLTIQK